MNILSRIIRSSLLFLTCLIIVSCTDSPTESVNYIDYGRLRIGKMDLSGAKSIGFKSKGETRAIDGQYVSAGMYKVDENGNISAVAVYFTTDTLGNRLEHEEKLRIVPSHLANLTDNYFIVIDCSYYDSDDDLIEDKWEYDEITDESKWIEQEVPYKHLLVRKSDGKIWCIDNICDQICYWDRDYYHLQGKFTQSNIGDLYFTNKDDGCSFKFNLSGDSPSFEQITTGAGMLNRPEEIVVTDNGIIGGHWYDGLYYGWPHSGFTSTTEFSKQYFDFFSKDFPNFDIEDLTVYEVYGYDGRYRPIFTDFRLELKSISAYFKVIKNTIYLSVRPYYQLTAFDYYYYKKRIRFDYSFRDNYLPTESEFLSKIKDAYSKNLPSTVFYRIEPGSQPGDIRFTKLASLVNSPSTEISFSTRYETIAGAGLSFVWDENKAICLGIKWISCLNLNDNSWEYVKEYNVEDESNIPYYEYSYDGKLWSINTDKEKFGANWFNPNTLEFGFVKFPELPSFMSYTYGDRSDIEKYGYIKYWGVDPATSNRVNIWIDIRTGEMVDEITAPEMIFETIIPLN